jgi:hypothetical protein
VNAHLEQLTLRLYGRVVIPPAVKEELMRSRAPVKVQAWIKRKGTRFLPGRNAGVSAHEQDEGAKCWGPCPSNCLSPMSQLGHFPKLSTMPAEKERLFCVLEVVLGS